MSAKKASGAGALSGNARGLVFSALAVLFVIIFSRPLSPGGLWDFNSYYYSAAAFQSGLNPYDFAAVNSLIPDSGSKISRGTSFPYHPWFLPIFQAFTRFSFETARGIYLFLSAAACVAICGLWFKTICPVGGKKLRGFLICFLLCPGFPLIMIFKSGNTAPFEALLIWLGIYLTFRKRPISASSLFCAAGFFKLTSFLNLAVMMPIMALGRRDRAMILVMAALTIGLFFAPAAVGSPQFTDLLNYLKEVSVERYVNYSSAMFFYSALEEFGLLRCHFLLYAAWSAFVFAVFLWRIYRGEKMPLAEKIILALWTAALITPRLRPYAFLSLVPAYYSTLEKSRAIFALSLAASALLYQSPLPILSNHGIFIVNLINWIYAVLSGPSNLRAAGSRNSVSQ